MSFVYVLFEVHRPKFTVILSNNLMRIQVVCPWRLRMLLVTKKKI